MGRAKIHLGSCETKEVSMTLQCPHEAHENAEHGSRKAMFSFKYCSDIAEMLRKLIENQYLSFFPVKNVIFVLQN